MVSLSWNGVAYTSRRALRMKRAVRREKRVLEGRVVEKDRDRILGIVVIII